MERGAAQGTIYYCSWCRAGGGLFAHQRGRSVAQIGRHGVCIRSLEGRREDAVDGPAKRLPFNIGDVDGGADIDHLRDLEFGRVVNRCADRFAMSGRAGLAAAANTTGIQQRILGADGCRGFDIVSVARVAVHAMRAALGDAPAISARVRCRGWGIAVRRRPGSALSLGVSYR